MRCNYILKVFLILAVAIFILPVVLAPSLYVYMRSPSSGSYYIGDYIDFWIQDEFSGSCGDGNVRCIIDYGDGVNQPIFMTPVYTTHNSITGYFYNLNHVYSNPGIYNPKFKVNISGTIINSPESIALTISSNCPTLTFSQEWSEQNNGGYNVTVTSSSYIPGGPYLTWSNQYPTTGEFYIGKCPSLSDDNCINANNVGVVITEYSYFVQKENWFYPTTYLALKYGYMPFCNQNWWDQKTIVSGSDSDGDKTPDNYDYNLCKYEPLISKTTDLLYHSTETDFCNDNVDNDCDGPKDCDDTVDCSNSPNCCSDECSTMDAKACVSGITSGYKICGNYDNDNCLDWSTTITQCQYGCENGTCIQPTCSNECLDIGQKACSGNYKKICGNYDTDPCFEWNMTLCQYGCENDECKLQNITINVTNGTAPTIISQNMTIKENQTFTIEYNIIDTTGGQPTVEFSGWITTRTYKPSFDEQGVHFVTIKACNKFNNCSSKDISINVTNVNRAPVIEDQMVRHAYINRTIIFTIIANDPDMSMSKSDNGTGLIYSVNSSSINISADGRVSWLPKDGNIGNNVFKVMVSDGELASEKELRIYVAKEYIPVITANATALITIVKPEQNFIFKNKSIIISYKRYAASDYLIYELDNEMFLTDKNNTEGEIEISGLDNGKHNVTLYAVNNNRDVTSYSDTLYFEVRVTENRISILKKILAEEISQFVITPDTDTTTENEEVEITVKLPQGLVDKKVEGVLVLNDKKTNITMSNFRTSIKLASGANNYQIALFDAESGMVFWNSENRVINYIKKETEAGTTAKQDVSIVSITNRIKKSDVQREDIIKVSQLKNEKISEIINKNQNLRDADKEMGLVMHRVNITKDNIDVRMKASVITVKDKITNEKKNITEISLQIRPKSTLYNLSVYGEIPKSIAADVSELEFAIQPEVINADPLIVWHFAKVDKPIDLSYKVNSEVDLKDIEEINTVIISDSVQESKLKMILPIIIIPFVIAIVIIFSRFDLSPKQNRQEKNTGFIQQESIKYHEEIKKHNIKEDGTNYEALDNFIITANLKGWNIVMIKNALTSHGWNEETIDVRLKDLRVK